MQIVSLQIGQPRERTSAVEDGNESAWVSSIWKLPVTGRLRLGREDLVGNAQADLKNHGGPEKAVCCYASEHYPEWRATLGESAETFPFGAFGENFTLAGLTEDTVRNWGYLPGGNGAGTGEPAANALLETGAALGTPCASLAVQASGRTGYYFRVLEPGEVGAGDTLTRLERPLPEWTVTHVNHAMYVDKADAELAEELSRLPLLAEAWRRPFRRRAGLLRHQANRD